jgi:hypothetical protein
MNKIARKLVLSALTVVLTVVALGTTTFAWFTLTNTAVVQPFQASIVTDTGIEVAINFVDATHPDLIWYTTLTEAIIEDYIVNSSGFTTFTHITTTTGYNNFNTLGSAGVVSAGGGWLEIPLIFRSNSATAIDWTAVTLTSPASNWTTDVAFTSTIGAVGANSIISIDASNAMRMSVQGTTFPGGTQTNTVFVYEKGAVNSNVILGGDGVTPVNYANGVAADQGNAGSYNYYFVKTGALIGEALPTPTGTYAVIAAPTVTTINGTTNILRVTDLVADTTYGTSHAGTITIRIWLEGWDADAYNSVLAREITAGFTFVGGTAGA